MLLGNHDLWLREFAGGRGDRSEQAASWMRFGGDATLLSYGVKLDLRKPEPERFAAARRQLQRASSRARRFPRPGSSLAFGFGDYFFCHAGIRPDMPLEQQTEADSALDPRAVPELGRRVRQDRGPWPHGRGSARVRAQPDRDRHRRLLDRRRLTCLVLDGTERRFLQTGRWLASPPPRR